MKVDFGAKVVLIFITYRRYYFVPNGEGDLGRFPQEWMHVTPLEMLQVPNKELM